MDRRRVILAGYAASTPQAVLDAATQLDAVIFDIRYSPRSRNPAWSQARLGDLLGHRYRHVPEFGNRNYKTGGPVVLADPASGLAVFDGTTGDVILLCRCRVTATCHRKDVGDYLMASRGVDVLDLTAALMAPGVRQLPLTEQIA